MPLQFASEVITAAAGSDPARHAFRGAVAMAVVDDKPVLDLAVGTSWPADCITDPAAAHAAVGPMRRDCVFDLASLTKVMATAPSVLLLVDRGMLALDDPVQLFFPQAAGTSLGLVTVRQLLLHTSGLPQQADLFAAAYRPAMSEGGPADNLVGGAVSVVSKMRLLTPPGTHVNYSCAGYIVLGGIVEAVADCSLQEFATANIFAPLGMSDTGFFSLDRSLPASARGRIVPTESRSTNPRASAYAAAFARRGLWLDEWRARHIDGDTACGIVYDDESGWLGGVAGNTGLFSTARDIAAFGGMWLRDGAAPDGRQVLSPAAVAAAKRCYTCGCTGDDMRGLGWQLPSSDKSLGDWAMPDTFGHAGFTGTGLWITPSLRLVTVLLTNRLQLSRDCNRMPRLRKLFNNAVFAEITAMHRRTGGNGDGETTEARRSACRADLAH